ncbi:hypothetical protein ACFX2C_019206 [Malus domestica]
MDWLWCWDRPCSTVPNHLASWRVAGLWVMWSRLSPAAKAAGLDQKQARDADPAIASLRVSAGSLAEAGVGFWAKVVQAQQHLKLLAS